MNEFLEQFLAEALELVEQAGSDLLALERSPADRESLDGAFRAFHTLKGGAGIVDFAAMARAMHAAEDVLSAVRAGTRAVTPLLIGDCLASLDQVVQWLDAIRDNGDLPGNAGDDADRIVALFGAEPGDAGSRSTNRSDIAPDVSGVTPLAVLREQALMVGSRGEGWHGRIAAAARVAANILRQLARPAEADGIEQALLRARETGDGRILVHAIERSAAQLADAKPVEAGAPASGDLAMRTLRVDAGRVDTLVKIAGELTVAKNALGHIAKLARKDGNPLAQDLADQHARTGRLLGDLHRAVLGLRMLPVRRVFQPFSRLVREMSTSLAKPVRLITEGQETEVDKAVVEMLFEPLLHVVRNAIDHGIESERDRAASGKPAVATIQLRARREGDQVVIEVEDDGRGIDPHRIRKAAAERGIESPDALAAMNDDEVVDLIFAPGFSTANDVTDLSGRGVGLDAVRTAIFRLGGTVLVQSRSGQGCTLIFRLPLSVMMTRVMIVDAGGQLFGLPLDVVVETLRLRREDIRPLGGGKAFVLRNRTLPLIDLGEALGRPRIGEPVDATVVVACSGGLLAGVEVDHVGEWMDVMLRPPEGLLCRMPGVSGTTLLGDGNVLLVLDLQAMFR